MLTKGSVIVNKDRKLIFKVIEVDATAHEYVLKLLYPEPPFLSIIRKDVYQTHCECEVVL